jgi:hypothetical protein
MGKHCVASAFARFYTHLRLALETAAGCAFATCDVAAAAAAAAAAVVSVPPVSSYTCAAAATAAASAAAAAAREVAAGKINGGILSPPTSRESPSRAAKTLANEKISEI